jgi:predicted kinase
MQPTLYVFSGLPASGKSTLSRRLATTTHATHLRIDTIEQALRDLCSFTPGGEGYELAYRLATENLLLGNSVIADSCNPIELTRDAWQLVADTAAAACFNVEVICSDPAEHERRVATRSVDVPGLKLPSWQEVLSREYVPWTTARVVVGTAGRSERTCFDELCRKLADARIERGS